MNFARLKPNVADDRYVRPSSDFPAGPVQVPSGVCVLLFSGSLFDTVRGSRQAANEPPEWTNRRMPLVVTSGGVAVHFPLYGSPRAAAAVEQLAYCGVHTLVGVGLCGSLRQALPIGSIVSAVGAIRGDAVSHHYLPAEYPAVPDPGLQSGLRRLLAPQGAMTDVVQLSTDALYRETRSEIDYWRENGASTIDMECAAFLVVARALRLRAAWVGVVSDMLDGAAHEGSIGGAPVMPLAAAIANAAIDFFETDNTGGVQGD